MPDFSIGVDLGGTNLRIAAVSDEGQLLEKITLGTNLALGRNHVIDEMCDAMQRLSGKYKETGDFLGAGIGFPGLIDIATGRLRKAVNLPGFEGYAVREEIERRMKFPKNDARVVIENDGRVAALGEQWRGAARNFSNAAMLTLGTGIGGGIVLGGKIWHGMNGMAGEFGHVTLEPEGRPCGCGNRGCAEQYASASAIVRMAQEAIARGEAPTLARAAAPANELGAEALYKLAIQGDEQAGRIFRNFGRYLGLLLASLVNILNLEMFVIGGGVSSAWDAYAPSMFEELRERSVVYAATAPPDFSGSDAFGKKEEGAVAQAKNRNERKTIITRALLGSDAGLYGAARVAVLAR